MYTFLGLVVLAYLLGGIPTGLVVARRLGGADPRQAGSGNIGAANMFRLLGRRAGFLTLLGDVFKGAVPTFLALFWLHPLGAWAEAAVAMVGGAAVLGHIFPVYLGFKGGKGVATSFGVMVAVVPWAALNLLVVYLLAVYRTRVSSVGSLFCAWLLPLAVGLFSDSKAYLLLAGVISGLILLRHRENLERLVKGEELPMF